MIGFGPWPGASGGDVIGAPSPDDGNAVRPRSFPPPLGGGGARTGSGGGGAAAAPRGSGPDVERFPNTLVPVTLCLLAPELFEQRRQQASTRALHFGAPGER